MSMRERQIREGRERELRETIFLSRVNPELLGNASVKKELKLNDQQAEKSEELIRNTRAEMREKLGLFDLSREERRTKMREVDREISASTLKAVGAFLKPEQITRYVQISYQQSGVQAFRDPEVVQKLNLTDSQKSDIEKIFDEFIAEMITINGEESSKKVGESTAPCLFGKDAHYDPKAFMYKRVSLRMQTLNKAKARLNDEQQKIWKELCGDPFEMEYKSN